MAQLWTTGPALIYAGFNANPGSAIFVGTCEARPQIDVEYHYYEVKNDLAGLVPADKGKAGKRARVVCPFTRFNENVVAALDNDNPNSALAALGVPAGGAARGATVPGDVGGLMGTEGQNVYLYVFFPYFAKAAYGAGAGTGVSAAMPPGYRFPFATLDREGLDVGAEARRTTQAFDCLPLLSIGSANSFGTTYSTLYDFVLAGLPSPN